MGKSRKMKGGCHGQRRTTVLLLQEGVQTSDIRVRLAAICAEKAPARNTVFNCAVARKPHRWMSMTANEAPLKNGSLKTSGSCQVDGSDVQTQGQSGRVAKTSPAPRFFEYSLALCTSSVLVSFS